MDTPPKMEARARSASTSVSPGRPQQDAKTPGSREALDSSEALLSSQACPEDFFQLLRELIKADRIGQAQKLTREAVRRFPNNHEVRRAKTVLVDGGKATPNPYVQPTATAEIEWLKNPPDEARGKWVALIGSDLVGMADSVEKLRQSLATKKFDHFPLVQYLAP